jgi:regulator of sigma E protease
MITGKEKPELSGPVGIVRETAKAVKAGFAQFLFLLGLLSAYLGAFNLLPIPALDGGRLMFLGYEAATRRRPNPRIEAQVHAVGLFMMLALIAVVTIVSDLQPGRH